VLTEALFIGLALTLRPAGSVLRVGGYRQPIHAMGWFLCMGAVWSAISAAGGWPSLWPAGLIAVVGVALRRWTNQQWLWLGSDMTAVLLLGLFAIPPLSAPLLALSLFVILVVGAIVDHGLLLVAERVRLAGLLALMLGGIVLGLALPSVRAGTERLLRDRLDAALVLPLSRTASSQSDIQQPQDTQQNGAVASLDREGLQWTPYLEWTLVNPTWSGNPYDLVASATFVHQPSGETRTTEMFYDGDATWKWRFTGTQPGTWTFTTTSTDPELADKRGTVVIKLNPGVPGFVVGEGNTWIRTGTDAAFVPQFVMYSTPQRYHNNPDKIDADIDLFLKQHGFNGLHTNVFCRWFDIEQASCSDVNVADPHPDRRTFEALELLITKVHAHGGVVHIWAWGDDTRNQTPRRWGINGAQDRRLQRYIAARLGPLPGWTMGYGFDLWEWVNDEQLTAWHDYLHQHFGWLHLLGARSQKNELTQLSEAMDYASYEQHRPDYEMYVRTLEERPSKPAFSEDRFRIRDEGNEKDYTMTDTRRGLWRSTMAGGVANIWGNLIDSPDSEGGNGISGSYPNPEQIKAYAEFFRERFTKGLMRCNNLTDGVCLKRIANTHLIFYKEDAAAIRFDLSEMPSAQRVVAVDALQPYAEIDLGRLPPEQHSWTPPYASDWAIAVGDFEAVNSH